MSLSVGEVKLRVDGRVASAVIDHEKAKNALSPHIVDGLSAAIDQATQAGCTVFVLCGAGGTISAGADLKHLHRVREDAATLREYITAIGETLDKLEAAPFISICVVDGYAVAGGCEIMLACDLAVASEDARIGDRHLEYGLLPGAGGSVRLSQTLPSMLARRLLYTGEIIDGRTAASFGLVSHVAPAAELQATVDSLVARLARHSPEALLGMKRLHRAALVTEPEHAIVDERETLIGHLDSATAKEGLAAFAEGRAPDFSAEAGI